MSDSEVEEVFTNNKKMSIGKSKSSVNIPKKRNKYIHSDNESLNEDELGLDFLANPNQIQKPTKPVVNNDILIDSSEDEDDNQHIQENNLPEQGLPIQDNYDEDEDAHINLDQYKEPERDFEDASQTSGDKSVFMGNERSEYDMSQAEIVKEKRRLLFKLFRYKKKGINLSENFNMNSSLESLRTEFHTIKKEINLDQSVNVAKNMLISTVSIVELLNNKYDPFDVYLKGWSEEVNENIDDYDDVFEELYDKYEDSIEVSPEIKLMMMLGGSAVKYHIAHTVMKSFMPNNQADSFLRTNPDLKNKIGEMVNNRMQQQSGINMNNMPKRNMSMPMRPQNKQQQNPSLNKPKNLNSLMSQLESNANKKKSLNIEL